MTKTSSIPERVVRLFETWAEALRGMADDRSRIEYVRKRLPPLMADTDFFRAMLEKIAKGGPFPDIGRSGLFENEITLYTNPSSLFSLRIAAYEPDEYTIVHDHSSWGVFGALCGQLETIRYVRKDDGSRKGYAKVSENGRRLLAPGEVDSTLPLDRGIHSIGNPGREMILTASVYGKPVRRLFIQRFHPENDRVEKIFPPKLRKKMQARRALPLIGEVCGANRE